MLDGYGWRMGTNRYGVAEETFPTTTPKTAGWAVFDRETGRIATPVDRNVFLTRPEAEQRAEEMNAA